MCIFMCVGTDVEEHPHGYVCMLRPEDDIWNHLVPPSSALFTEARSHNQTQR